MEFPRRVPPFVRHVQRQRSGDPEFSLVPDGIGAGREQSRSAEPVLSRVQNRKVSHGKNIELETPCSLSTAIRNVWLDIEIIEISIMLSASAPVSSK